MEDIRWIQRLNNFEKAFKQLQKGVETALSRELSDLEKEGIIQRFEYTQELAWKTVKDFYESLGETNIQGSADAFRMAFEKDLIKSGNSLMKSIKSRNNTVHTYNEKTAEEIYQDIIKIYYHAFLELFESLNNQKKLRKL